MSFFLKFSPYDIFTITPLLSTSCTHTFLFSWLVYSHRYMSSKISQMGKKKGKERRREGNGRVLGGREEGRKKGGKREEAGGEPST